MLFPRRWVRNGWTRWRWASAAALAVVGAAATSDAWLDMLRIAKRDEESSHAFLVPFIVVWLIWLRRGRLRQCRPTGFWVGPCMVACGWVLYSLGDTQLLQSLWHAGAVAVTVGSALTILGRDLLVRFLPALLALVFIVPVPARVRQRVAIPLEAATARVTHEVLLAAGQAVERSGNVLQINGVDVAIAEACNGMRMVFALTLVSYGFAFGTPLRLRTRVVILLASPVSAITCNVARLVPTVWLYGHRSTAPADAFHNAAGWVMLGVSFLVLLGLVRLLRWAMVPVGPYTLAHD